MAGWARRVFLSYTSELHELPRDRSFVAAAEAAVIRAGNVVADMAHWTACEEEPADHCRRMVAASDVYVGIIGFRYGSPVRDRPDLSHVELEYEVASERGLPRLIFLLDEETVTPLPPNQVIDHQHGRRQHAFRSRLKEAGPTAAIVATPAELEGRLLQALLELAAAEDEPARGGAGLIGGSVGVPLGRQPAEVRGREDLLRELQDARGLVVLAAMGGMGKSTVAAELARRVPDGWPVWWVSAADASSLTAGMVTVARRLGASEAELRALATQAGDAPDRFWALLERWPEGWRGRHADAEAAFGQVLEARRRVLGPDHHDVLDTLHELARTITGQGRWAEAETHYRALLETRQRVLGPDHPSTLHTRHYLARHVARFGRWEGIQAARPGAENGAAATHRSAAETLWAEADAAFRALLAAQRRVLGDDHLSTLATCVQLGRLAADRGRPVEAGGGLEPALEALEAVLDDDHPDVLEGCEYLAWTEGVQGRWHEAEAALRGLLEVRQRVHGDLHPYTLATRHLLGRTLAADGRTAAAETAFRDLLDDRTGVLGAHHPDTVTTLVELARTTAVRGGWAEAEAAEWALVEANRLVLENPRA